jgi:NAD(P)H dehydrogenase (quinone)
MSYVIAGGTGRVGTKVALQLLSEGEQVRALTRDKARALKHLGDHETLELFEVDYAVPATLAGAFNAGDRVFVALGRPSDQQVRSEIVVMDAAASADVELLVDQSVYGLEVARVSDDNIVYHTHRRIEPHLTEITLASTIIRPSSFIDMTLNNAANLIPKGAWGGNVGDGVCTFIDTRDIADAAVTLLKEGPARHSGKVYTLTGPEALSMARVAELISAEVGYEVRFQQRGESENLALLEGLGLSKINIASLRSLDDFTRERSMGEVRDDLPSILEKPARTVAAYIAEYAPQLLPTKL